MAMSVEGHNPYASPKASDPPPEPPFVSRHEWRGHIVTIESTALASRLWLFTGYIITIDEKSFVTAQFGATEDFRWRFEHSGEMVNGHFQTHGLNNGIARKYTLELDDEPLGMFQLRITGGWKSYIVLGITCAIAGVVLARQWLTRGP
jgi:hypothetical protein